MRVPLSWLAEHVDVDVPVATLADTLTFAGIEIETIHRVGDDLAGILTARVLEVTQHPDADRLVLVRVDAGGEDRSVVCGARNFAPGDVVAWAAPGAKLPGGVEIGRRTVRGAVSDGMLASARELGVFDDHSGILVLPPDTPVGVDAVEAVGLRDSVLDIKTAPNRGDILSMRGVAREVALLLGRELKPLDLTVPETGPAAEGLASVAVEDADRTLALALPALAVALDLRHRRLAHIHEGRAGEMLGLAELLAPPRPLGEHSLHWEAEEILDEFRDFIERVNPEDFAG